MIIKSYNCDNYDNVKIIETMRQLQIKTKDISRMRPKIVKILKNLKNPKNLIHFKILQDLQEIKIQLDHHLSKYHFQKKKKIKKKNRHRHSNRRFK